MCKFGMVLWFRWLYWHHSCISSPRPTKSPRPPLQSLPHSSASPTQGLNELPNKPEFGEEWQAGKFEFQDQAAAAAAAAGGGGAPATAKAETV